MKAKEAIKELRKLRDEQHHKEWVDHLTEAQLAWTTMGKINDEIVNSNES